METKNPIISTPSKAADGGRDPTTGKFAKGNKIGVGNPHYKKIAAFRATMVNAVTQKDIQEIVRSTIERAKAGDMQAVKIIFAYTIGKAPEYEDTPGRPNVFIIQKNDGTQVLLGTEKE